MSSVVPPALRAYSMGVTVMSTLTASYIHGHHQSSQSADTAAELTTLRKSTKYANLEQSRIFKLGPSKIWFRLLHIASFLWAFLAIIFLRSLSTTLKAVFSGFRSQSSASMLFCSMINSQWRRPWRQVGLFVNVVNQRFNEMKWNERTPPPVLQSPLAPP